MSRQPPRGPPLSAPTRPSFVYRNPTSTQQQRGVYRADSRDSGIASSGYQAGPSVRQQQQSTSSSTVNEFDWGDDDDDMDIVMASQQVEAAVGQRGDNVPSTSRRLQSSPGDTRDAAMTLEMRRFELALKESNGEDVRMEDFMQDGCLGGDISADKDIKKTLLEKIEDLEKVNTQLKKQNYTCQGEVTNLRKLVEKQKKEKQQELLNRQKREKEIRDKEAEYKKKMGEKEEELQTKLKFKNGELRSAAEKNEALKKVLRKLTEPDSSLAGQISSSTVPKIDMDITKTLPSSTQSTSCGFNLSKNSFYKREVLNSPGYSAAGSPASLATIQLSPKKSVITTSAEVQTEDLLTEKPSEAAVLWKEGQELRLERLQNKIEKISMMATRDFQLILPKLKKISQSAEKKLVRELNIEGYRYELFFPGNLKIAEFKMDLDKKTKPRKNPRISKFPSQCEDWRGIDAFETTVNQILFSQRDIWATMCYVLNDIVRRINCMRRKRRNSVYRANNCLHMFNLMSWAASLWYNFRQEFWLFSKPEDMENGIYEEIRQWTAAMLWIGNHYFGVLDFQVRIRPFVLRTLINMERNGIFHCTYSNYLRLYYLIYHTLTIDRHATAENLNLCLQLALAVDRKKFVIDFMCRGRNDGTCLAYLFGTKTMELFLKEKDPERRFRIYENYLKLLDTIRKWCCVHLSGESQCEDAVQQEDVDDTDVNPVFVTKEKFTERPTAAVGMMMSRRFHSTITSFYGSEEITFDDDDGDVDDNSTQPTNPEPARKKQRLDSKSGSSGTVNSNAAVRGTSSEIATQIMEENVSFRMPGGSDESEVSEDEYDELKAEAKEILENVRQRNQQADDDICRKFLDCSQWEEYPEGPKVGSCQCRHHLMETFMRMTDEVIRIWRHVKTNFEFQNLSNEASKAKSETLQTEVDELIRLLDEEERTEVKSNAEMDQDLQLSKENPYWKRIIQDGNMVKPVLRPDEISNKMNLIVDIIAETHLTTQHNTKQAFGSEGTNAFHAVIAYCLQFLKAFNISEYNREQIFDIASRSFTPDSGSCLLMSTANQKELEEIPSGYEEFDAPVVPFTEFPRDFKDENVRACLPRSVLQSIDEWEERIAAPRLEDSSMDQADEVVMEVDHCEQSRRSTRNSLNTSGDLFNQSTSKSNGKKDDVEDSCESASESEDVNEEDSGWETVDSDDDDVEGDEKRFVKVQDYDKFGGPALEEQAEFFEEPPQSFEVTHEQLLATFKKGPKIKCDNLVKFKSARTACEELKKTGSVTHTHSSATAGPSLDDCMVCQKDTDNLIQKLMSRMNVQDYYKDRNPLWNDYKDRSHPVNI